MYLSPQKISISMPRKKFKKSKHKKNRLWANWLTSLAFVAMILLMWSYAAVAVSPSLEQRLEVLEKGQQSIRVVADTVWVIFTGTLVFFMNAGFAMLETGFCRQKNAVNLLSKNLIVFALSTVAFWAIGFGIMFGDGNGLYGQNGFFLSPLDNSPITGGDYRGVYTSLSSAAIPLQAKFFFQLVFAGIAATIVSGAVAERIKYGAFLIFSLLFVSLSYSVTGHWIWGKGWLSDLHFWDFAGSTVVHSVGGWAGLIGTLLLGARLGKYQDDGKLDRQRLSYSPQSRSVFGKKIVAIPGHNLSISTLGALILWLGWFGFNCGSTLAADPPAITHILLTTNMAAATGGLAATITSWVYFGKPDLSFLINGILAGAVSITASCAFVNIAHATIIGTVAGVIVVFSAVFLDKLEIDDPVGAISVHLICGIWGTLAVGLFSVGPNIYPWYGENHGPGKGLFLGGGLNQIFAQVIGIVSVGVFTALFSLFAWSIIKLTIGLRVSQDEEIEGLDLSEHSMSAYEYEISEKE
jgi:Amt family ammonium transporter